jgi:3-oxoacyl-[acyl-carrier-protein] synthase-3
MTLNRVQIGYSDFYKPDSFFELEDFFKAINFKTPSGFPSLSSFCKNIISNKGIERIYYENEKTRLEILENMVAKYFEVTQTDPGEIGMIIYARGMSTENEVNIPYNLQKVFHMKNARVFNIEQTCSGSAISIEVARSFIMLNRMKKALILSTHFMEDHWRRNINVTIMSDGAGILEIKALEDGNNAGNAGIFEILDYDVTTEGSTKFNLSAFSNDDVNSAIKTIKKGSQHIKRFLEKHHLTINDVQNIIQQNIGLMNFGVYSDLLNCSKDKFFLRNIPDGGHMGDVDLIRNFSDYRNTGLGKQNDLVIIFCTGWGTSWSTILLRI